MNPNLQFLSFEPVLWCSKIVDSVHFYRDKLCFSPSNRETRPEMKMEFIHLGERGPHGLTLILKQHAGPIVPQELRIWVSNLKALQEELGLRDKPYATPIIGFPHAAVVLTVTDPDGHQITFAEAI